VGDFGSNNTLDRVPLKARLKFVIF